MLRFNIFHDHTWILPALLVTLVVFVALWKIGFAPTIFDKSASMPCWAKENIHSCKWCGFGMVELRRTVSSLLFTTKNSASSHREFKYSEHCWS